MNEFNLDQTVWVTSPVGVIASALVVERTIDRLKSPEYKLRFSNGSESTIHPSRIFATRDEATKSFAAKGHDFTEQDEPLGEVPDLPPMHTNHRCDTTPTMPHVIIHQDGSIEQLTELFTNRYPNALAGSWGMEPRPLSRTEPVMDTTGKNIPADPRILPHERPHNSIPADRRREAVRDAYGIITQFAVEYVDVTDVLRIAEYINNGIDYADTTVSIQAEALRTETDAATDVAVSKIQGERVPDGKRWD